MGHGKGEEVVFFGEKMTVHLRMPENPKINPLIDAHQNRVSPRRRGNVRCES